MSRRIFICIFGTVLCAIAVETTLVLFVLRYFLQEQTAAQLAADLSAVAEEVARSGEPYECLRIIDSANHALRYTWIAPDGEVLFDSASRPEIMENHLSRPEIAEAFANGSGSSRRYSDTLVTQTFYTATRLPDGSVLRVSTMIESMLRLTAIVMQPLLLIIFVLMIISVILALRMANRIIEPINKLNLEHPEANDVYDELAPLLRRLAHQQADTKLALEEITAQRRSFDEITAQMNEGLIVLNMSGAILSLNPSALKIMRPETAKNRARLFEGKPIQTLSRNADFLQAVRAGLDGSPSETMFEIAERTYRVGVTPGFRTEETVSDGEGLPLESRAQTGVIVLVVDETDRHAAEKARREFTANVSHELKTPLTSILGYAEIIKNGVAKPRDISSFAGRIESESKRLLALIDDIIRLAQFDEGSKNSGVSRTASAELIDIYELAGITLDRLAPLAQRCGVALKLSGESCFVLGIRALLDELIFNLCDNAVRYNKQDGSVVVTTLNDENCVRLIVEDTGIGIPEEDKERVFERFYRVDKSRSRETGGTGLGLSIVRHIAEEHRAKLILESVLDVGTKITVEFPAEV